MNERFHRVWFKLIMCMMVVFLGIRRIQANSLDDKVVSSYVCDAETVPSRGVVKELDVVFLTDGGKLSEDTLRNFPMNVFLSELLHGQGDGEEVEDLKKSSVRLAWVEAGNQPQIRMPFREVTRTLNNSDPFMKFSRPSETPHSDVPPRRAFLETLRMAITSSSKFKCSQFTKDQSDPLTRRSMNEKKNVSTTLKSNTACSLNYRNTAERVYLLITSSTSDLPIFLENRIQGQAPNTSFSAIPFNQLQKETNCKLNQCQCSELAKSSNDDILQIVHKYCYKPKFFRNGTLAHYNTYQTNRQSISAQLELTRPWSLELQRTAKLIGKHKVFLMVPVKTNESNRLSSSNVTGMNFTLSSLSTIKSGKSMSEVLSSDDLAVIQAQFGLVQSPKDNYVTVAATDHFPNFDDILKFLQSEDERLNTTIFRKSLQFRVLSQHGYLDLMSLDDFKLKPESYAKQIAQRINQCHSRRMDFDGMSTNTTTTKNLPLKSQPLDDLYQVNLTKISANSSELPYETQMGSSITTTSATASIPEYTDKMMNESMESYSVSNFTSSSVPLLKSASIVSPLSNDTAAPKSSLSYGWISAIVIGGLVCLVSIGTVGILVYRRRLARHRRPFTRNTPSIRD